MPAKRTRLVPGAVAESNEPKHIPQKDTELTKKILAGLDSKLVGTFTADYRFMDTTWTDYTSNRAVNMTAVKKLMESFDTQGINRLEIQNHTCGSAEQYLIDEILSHHKLSKAKLKELNAKRIYPPIDPVWMENKGYHIRSENGQHRFRAVQEYYADDGSERWWPMRLYARPLTIEELVHLRRNDRTQALPTNDGTKLLLCYQLEDQLEKAKIAAEPEDTINR